ncbi:hypothetical protein ACS7SF_12475 [Ralstonia sp. 25C]|uniref:hypothetical protein n=1 Tax=Ralstonia sp. 25C TaxID=3447363 RepID=UPI003F74CD95
MSQNLISLDLSPTEWKAIDTTLQTLESQLRGLIDLSTEQRGKLVKMGDKSEAFCRKALDVLTNNPGVLPGNFNLAEMQRDLQAFDALRGRLLRVERLYEKMRDSQLALGSDVMSAALDGYAFLKVAGKGEGLDLARQALSVHFTGGPRKKAPVEEAS